MAAHRVVQKAGHCLKMCNSSKSLGARLLRRRVQCKENFRGCTFASIDANVPWATQTEAETHPQGF